MNTGKAYRDTESFSSTPDSDTGAGTPANTPKPTVDLAPCNFGGTLRHPCFWILVGVVGCLAGQYLLSNIRKP
jgi:hypothetical protein